VYEAFYGLTEKPFSIIPDPSFLYLSRQHSMALDLVEYGLINQAGFNIITGAIGTGKTTLIRFILNHIDRDISVGLISNTHRDFGELLQWILFAFKQDYHGKCDVEMFETFVDFLTAEYARGHGTLLIIDEAQNMSVEALEQLRMLSNINADKDQLLQIILVGQVGLRNTLRRPELEQFAQRIAVHYHLDPLDDQETRAYIWHRLKRAGAANSELFDAAACHSVYRYTGGVPRLINLLCDTAMVYGYAEGKAAIDASIIEAVAHDKLTGGLFRARTREEIESSPVSDVSQVSE
jgi:type II secretory pathway predicted ATPase ExeA